MKFYIIHGPNINLLGSREPHIYGRESYESLLAYIGDNCREQKIEAEFFQSNHEGNLVDYIQKAATNADGIIINAAAYTHTSIAILDALKAVNLPTVEVHLSNLAEREPFRKISYVSKAALKTIMGKGFVGYREAIIFLKSYIKNREG